MTKEELQAELDSGKKPAKIAREIGKSPQTVLNWMEKWGLKRLADKLSVKFLKQRILRDGQTKQDVASELHINVTTVNKFIARKGLKLDICDHCGNRFHSSKNTMQHCSLECVAWSQIDKRGPKECWNYTGSNLSNGYGRIWNGDGHTVAHLVIWRMLRDPPPTCQELRHQCGNRLCCNPKHLKIGTRSQNVEDSKRDGTYKAPHECEQKYKLTSEDHQIIRLLESEGWGCKKIQRVYFPLVHYTTIYRHMKKKIRQR